MKIHNIYLIGIIVFAGWLTACTPQEEDVHPRRRSARNENLKRYMPRAQELRAQAQLRAKSIVNGPLLTEEDIKGLVAKPTPISLSAYLLEEQKVLQETVRSSASQEAVAQTTKLLDGINQEMIEAISSADSAQDLAQQLRNFAARYSNELNALADNVKQDAWTLPTTVQSREARNNLKKAGEDLLVKIQELYGDTCAQKARPVLAKVGDDYWLALSSVKNPEELKQTLTKTGQDADEMLAQIIAQYGDPEILLPAQDAAALRARLIEGHQRVEQQFERLYGKDAVLKTRDIFESYLDETDNLFQKKSRLSEKMAKLDELGSKYRQEITALQVQLNDELEHKMLTSAQPGQLAVKK